MNPKQLNSEEYKKFDIQLYFSGKWSVEVDLKFFGEQGIIGVANCDSKEDAIKELFEYEVFKKYIE